MKDDSLPPAKATYADMLIAGAMQLGRLQARRRLLRKALAALEQDIKRVKRELRALSQAHDRGLGHEDLI
jgi:hypothetical protein